MTRAFAVLLMLSALSGCGDKGPDPKASAPAIAPNPNRVSIPPDSPKLRQIKVEPVVTDNVPADEVTSPGKIEVNPNRVAHISLPVAGRVVTVGVKIGDFVRQGQSVLTVESPDIDQAVSAYQQAQAGVLQSRAAQTKARADLERARDLFEHNAVAQKEVLNAESLHTQAGAAVEQAEAGLQQARRRLEIYGVRPGEFGQRLTVHSPISGKVLEMNVVPGEFRNDTSAAVVTIADLSTVWVTADIPETSIRFIDTGERVSVEFSAYPSESFTARVTQIADMVDPQTRTIKVRAELNNPDGRLKPEMFCRIHHIDRFETRPVVPVAAVVREEGRNVVWRESGAGVFERVDVEPGAPAAGRVAILSGLSAGDRVVTDGVMLLKGN